MNTINSSDTGHSTATKWIMAGIAVLFIIISAVWGYFLITSIPMISKLPDGVETPLDYVLTEATARFAIPLAFFGILGAVCSLVATIFPQNKSWLEFFTKLSAVCVFIYTGTLVFASVSR